MTRNRSKYLLHRNDITDKEPEGFSPDHPDRFHEVGATRLIDFTPSMMAWLEDLGTFMTVPEIAAEFETLPLA